MAHRVAWSRRALQDVEAIADYIAADSPTYAGIVVKKVVNQTQMLAKFPRAGRKVPEFDDEKVRELVVYSYRLIYRLQDDEVVIAAVIHGKRMLTATGELGDNP
ncbi:MAG: type II toxin-antitoxin system RelE/ParE family toxin [Candidatus Sulfotelmatobacter sp.]|jgi:addiction module RelE/StbE family toxin